MMRFANRNLTRRCTIMRFANRTQFPKQNGVEAEKLVKTVRFGQRRLIENWVKYSTRYSVLNR